VSQEYLCKQIIKEKKWEYIFYQEIKRFIPLKD
jgi:hypothetical protein